MLNPLRPEVLRPRSAVRTAAGLIVTSAAMAGGLLTCALIAGSAHHPARVEVPVEVTVAIAPAALPLAAEPIAALAPPVVERPAAELHFVVQAGDASFLVLEDLGDASAVPAHGPIRLSGEEWTPVAVADVDDAEVALEHRGWNGRRVVVEESCSATAGGFAIVSRLQGDTAYAMDVEGAEWTAQTAFAAGHKVLAVRLDRCDGGFARAADRAPMAIAVPVEDPRALEVARADFLASPAVAEARRELEEGGLPEALGAPDVITAVVMRHPTTGMVWISLHLRVWESCGGPDVNVWGLYRVATPGQGGQPGPVTRTRLMSLDSVDAIEGFVDVEGDGTWEMMTRGWLGMDTELRGEDGEVMKRLEMPFYGCPC